VEWHPAADEYFAGWTSSATVAEVRVPAGTYLVTAKVTGLGTGITCQVTIDTSGVLDQTRAESRTDSSTTLPLQAVVTTGGGTLQLHCASLTQAPIHLDAAKLHATRVAIVR
jgi:hypothetical protein